MTKVLVVDDAAFMRMVLKQMLQSNGYEVVGEAGNGKEALRMYELHKPDVITMDITMPEMDGVEATRQLMAHDCNARILMCSAMGQKEMVISAITAGAKDFVIKPFQEDRVIAAIQKIVAAR